MNKVFATWQHIRKVEKVEEVEKVEILNSEALNFTKQRSAKLLNSEATKL